MSRKKMIELTCKVHGKLTITPDEVRLFVPMRRGTGTHITTFASTFIVEESYEEVRSLLGLEKEAA